MTSKELIKKLPIVAENILEEAANQPQLFVEAAYYRVGKMRKQNQSGAALAHHISHMATKIRNKKNEAGEKITEGALKERIEINEATQQLREANSQAYCEEEFAKLLLEAFRMRAKALHVIADAKMYEGRSPSAEIDKIERRRLAARARDLELERRNSEIED
jgi:hypothetical protein